LWFFDERGTAKVFESLFRQALRDGSPRNAVAGLVDDRTVRESGDRRDGWDLV
jgi:hypothetical protein